MKYPRLLKDLRDATVRYLLANLGQTGWSRRTLGKTDVAMAEPLRAIGMRSGPSMLDGRAQASLQLAYSDAHSLRFYAGDNFGVGVYEIMSMRHDNLPLMTVYIHLLEYKSPHLYFDNKHNNHHFRDNFPEKISSAQLVICEGYISDRYNLYAPKGYALDMLVIGAPDVLDAVDRLNLGGDVEVLGDQLYMIFPDKIDLPGQLERIVQNGAELTKAFNDNLSRYRDDRAISFSEPIGYAGRRIIQK